MGMNILAKKTEPEEVMIDRIIAPGDKVEMRSINKVILPDETQGTKLYRTTITDVREDGLLEIAMPMEKTKLILLPVEGEYEVCFFTIAGMYRGNVRIVDRQKVENQYLLLAELTTTISKFQRREFYRFPCVLEAQVKTITQSQAHAISQNLSFLVPMADAVKAVIVDISGGGLRFIAKSPFPEDSLIQLQFVLKNQIFSQEYLLVGKVVKSGALSQRANEFENRVKFVDIDHTSREEIIKYIFEEERKNRKNRKR